jgi:acetylglutamate synthase
LGKEGKRKSGFVTFDKIAVRQAVSGLEGILDVGFAAISK